MLSRKTKHILLYITFGILLYAACMNFGSILGFLTNVGSLLIPLFFGLLFAFILNVPMNGLEKRMRLWWPNFCKRIGSLRLHIISLFLTLLIIVLLFFAAFRLALPAVIESAKSIGPLLQDKWPDILDLLNTMGLDTSSITSWVESLDIESLQDFDQFFSKTFSFVSNALSLTVSAVFGFIISIYILLTKDKLLLQSRKLIYAALPVEAAHQISYLFNLLSYTYSKFLSGTCVEACLLGIMMFTSFSLFQLPYAALTAFLTGLFAFVPYIGAFCSLGISLFLVFLINPHQVLLCLIVYTVTQFIENQFVYPHVVGSSVGLSPLFTLLAALLGGKLFGLLGIVFCIPLAAALYTILKDWTALRLKEKNIQVIYPKFPQSLETAAEIQEYESQKKAKNQSQA